MQVVKDTSKSHIGVVIRLIVLIILTHHNIQRSPTHGCAML